YSHLLLIFAELGILLNDGRLAAPQEILTGRWRTPNAGADFRNPGRRSARLRLRVIVVRPPERRQVPTEVQFEVARNAVTHIANLGTTRLRTWQGQQWEEQVGARLKLGSCRRPEPIDLGLRRGQRFTVERGQTPDESINKRVEVVTIQRAVHPAIALGDISIEVVPAKHDLKCPRAADQTREPFQRSAARDQSDADLGVAEQGALPAGEAHVAGQHELVTDSARATANLGDAYDWRGREAQHEVAPKAQHPWLFSCLGYVEMGDEKIGIRRLKHYDLHGRVRLEVGHQRSQFNDRCGNKHVDRRVAEGDCPP